jgi:hypothetical protein
MCARRECDENVARSPTGYSDAAEGGELSAGVRSRYAERFGSSARTQFRAIALPFGRGPRPFALRRVAYHSARVKRGHWIVAVVALGAALMWFAAAQSNSGQLGPVETGPETPSSAATTPVAREPAEPEPAAEPEPEAPGTPAAPSAQPASPSEQPTQPAPSGPTAPQRSGPVDALQQAFASEPRASSAVSAESAIEASFRRAEVPRTLLKSVLCRSTVCKVETRWSPERASGFMVAFMQLVVQPQEQHTFDHDLGVAPEGEPDADGSRAVTVYVKYANR